MRVWCVSLALLTGCSVDGGIGGSSRAIVGGADEAGFPAVGGLVNQSPGGSPSASFCSGTLIAPTWVLTAAHCVAGRDSSTLHFYVGEDTRADEDPGRQVVPARAVFVHPGYTAPGGDRPNDIALFELEAPPVGVEPIPIRRFGLTTFTASVVQYVGFGAARSNGGESGRKRSAVLRLQSILPAAYITEQVGGGVCFGDSGGPGLLPTSTTSWEVIGVNSTVFGDPSCEEYSTQIRVDSHATWIDSVMGIPGVSCQADPVVCQCQEACQADGICDNSLCGPSDCLDVSSCLRFCRTQLCATECFLNVTPEARYLYDEFTTCVAVECSDGNSDCVNERCRREIFGCENGLAAVSGDNACGALYRCEEGCPADDVGCLDACFYEGSLAAQADRDAVDACVERDCTGLEGEASVLCRARSCRDELLACLPDEACAIVGGTCENGACRPEAWAATYCLPSDGRPVGAACKLGSGDCADGALCVEGTCREVCATSTDCVESFGPCTPTRAEQLPFSVGVCSLDCADDDADGACNEVDCDPWDPARHPGATEVCDESGVDENCDGIRNEGCDKAPDAGVGPDLGGSDFGEDTLEPPEGCASTRGGSSFGLFALVLIGWGRIRWRRARRASALALLLALSACGEDVETAPDAAVTGPDLAVPDSGVLGPAPDASMMPPPSLDDVQQGGVAPGTLVTVEGVVTATFADGLFLGSAPTRAFGGLFVAAPRSGRAPGDRVRATGRVEEQVFVDTSSTPVGSRTLLRPEAPESLELLDRSEVPTPLELSLAELVLPELAEPYEGVLVRYAGPTHTGSVAERVRLDGLLDMSNEAARLDPSWVSEGTRFEAVVGILDFDAGGFFIRPRGPSDAPRRAPEAGGCLPIGEHLLCLQRTNWDDARVGCAERGGRLVVIETEEENALLGPRVREHTNRVFWLAATDRETEGRFTWTDGSTLTFSSWANGEPNDSGGAEDCAQGNFRAALTWNDGRCQGNQYFVCEFAGPSPRCMADADCGEARRCEDGRCLP